jgi:ABC-type phosphate/phosphonate transport system permease subunit
MIEDGREMADIGSWMSDQKNQKAEVKTEQKPKPKKREWSTLLLVVLVALVVLVGAGMAFTTIVFDLPDHLKDYQLHHLRGILRMK